MRKKKPIKNNLNEIQLDGPIYMVSKPGSKRFVDNSEEELWFQSAKESISAAKLFSKNHYFPSRVFNIQQAIEKLTKCLLMGSGASDNMLDIGHTPHIALNTFILKLVIKQCNSYV